MIDDVWSEADWDAIQCVLPDNNCGSRIIVATRIYTDARACSHGSDCIYPIKALSAEDSKKLFLSRVFGSTNGACPREIEVLVLISTVWAQRTKRALTRALIGGAQPVEGWWAPVVQHTYKRKRWGVSGTMSKVRRPLPTNRNPS